MVFPQLVYYVTYVCYWEVLKFRGLQINYDAFIAIQKKLLFYFRLLGHSSTIFAENLKAKEKQTLA